MEPKRGKYVGGHVFYALHGGCLSSARYIRIAAAALIPKKRQKKLSRPANSPTSGIEPLVTSLRLSS